MQIMILTGSGRFADPWHPFDGTSRRVADVLEQLHEVRVTSRTDVDSALADLDGVDLLVLNTGNPTRHVGPGDRIPSPDEIERARESIDAFLGRGGSVLALHNSASSWSDYPRLAERVGAWWIEGTSWHPPQAMVPVDVAAEHHVTHGMSGFRSFDERYSDLVLSDDVEVLLVSHDGTTAHPLLLVQEDGVGRSAYLALGHDEAAYESDEVQRLLARLALWLLHRDLAPQ